MVGSAFPYTEFLPKPGSARGVQIDIDGTRVSLRYPMEVNLSATARPPSCPAADAGAKDCHSWRNGLEKNVADWWKTLEERAMQSADPINPQRVFWELSPCLPDHCILTGDSGSVANWYARDIKMRRGMKGSLSGSLASLGAATPYAMAAKLAYPDRTVIAFIGDGAMQMNGLNVMITISKYWREWSNPHLIVMVLNNQDLNQVTWEERVQLGTGKTESLSRYRLPSWCSRHRWTAGGSQRVARPDSIRLLATRRLDGTGCTARRHWLCHEWSL